mmetsp:Transcript_2468/g.8764  ORF Transcript_2468/g.8764 Transcript_2468/m.8764 type:complete len:208 (-) Transcript_2468:612-1235(-)
MRGLSSSASSLVDGYLMPRSGSVSVFISAQSDATRLISTDGMFSLQLRLTCLIVASTWSSKSLRTWSLRPCGIADVSCVADHVWTNGRQPSSSGGTYTMPQRDTVAGDATARSCTSKSMRIVVGLSLMRSPLGRHSVQLSSSTVFMFSIQMASTGPSNTTHLRSSVVSATALRMSVLPRPSVHSLVRRLYSPYSSPILMHLGLNTYV